jgi:16S rRNA (guanine966-N2)-methyltransferase
MLKISGGFLRGRMLTAPKGEQTRPTSAQVRAALFNLIGQSCEDWRVLDCFAGSGALGFEALSRGAQAAVFVESHRLALQALRRNVADLGLDASVQIIASAAQQGLARCQGPFDLILADPPYHLAIDGEPSYLWIAKQIDQRRLLASGGWLIIEAPVEPPSLQLAHLVLRDVRRYGDTVLWLLRHHEPVPSGPERPQTES